MLKAGLMICDNSPYTIELCRGAHEACKELDIELVIFFGNTIDAKVKYHPLGYQKANIYAYASKLNLDFLIIPVSSICRTNEKLKRDLLHYFDLPIITLNAIVDDYPYVSYNNKKGVKDAVEYMIKVNNCKNIGLITAYSEGTTAKRRILGYKEALQENNIEYNDNYILETPGYSSNPGDLIKEWLNDNKDLDGIMCVTDDLAYYLYDELDELGIEIGKDIMVAGFNDSLESKHVVPPLASCHVDASLVSYLGIKKGYSYLVDKKINNRYIEAYFVPRLSVNYDQDDKIIASFIDCCKEENLGIEYIAEGISQYVLDNKLIYSLNYEELLINYFSFLLELPDNVIDHHSYSIVGEYLNMICTGEVIKYIDFERLYYCSSLLLDNSIFEDNKIIEFKRYVYLQMMNGYSSSLISLDNRHSNKMDKIRDINKEMLMDSLNMDISSFSEDIISFGINNAQLYLFETPIVCYEFRPFSLPEEMVLVVDIEDGKKKEIKNKRVKYSEMLDLCKSNYQFLNSVYANENLYGILVCDQSYFDLQILDYLANQIGISLNVAAIVNELNGISNTDELTKVYNRRGLMQHIKKLYTIAKEQNKQLYFLMGDLDNLKYINDHFGHDQGDKAIIGVCNILKNIFEDKAIIGRLGGDEIGVGFICDDIDFMLHMDSLIKEETRKYNQKYNNLYDISFSYGISVFDYEDNYDFNRIISYADSLMYERKKKKYTRGI